MNDTNVKTGTIAIMGIGNLLLGDEGVGVHAAWALKEADLPGNVEIIDVGTAFIDSIPLLKNAEHIIIIDAMTAGGKPGTLYRVTLEQCSKTERIDSLHGFDVFRMLALAENKVKTDIIVFGIEPSSLDWSTELSNIVSGSIPSLIDAVKKEITALS